MDEARSVAGASLSEGSDLETDHHLFLFTARHRLATMPRSHGRRLEPSRRLPIRRQAVKAASCTASSASSAFWSSPPASLNAVPYSGRRRSAKPVRSPALADRTSSASGRSNHITVSSSVDPPDLHQQKLCWGIRSTSAVQSAIEATYVSV